MAQATYVTSAIGTPITGANAKQSTNPFPAIHAKIASALDRADHSNKQFIALFLCNLGSAT